VQLVTLKYTQYGGEGYLRDGVEGFFVRESSSSDSGRRPGQAAFLFFIPPVAPGLQLCGGPECCLDYPAYIFIVRCSRGDRGGTRESLSLLTYGCG